MAYLRVEHLIKQILKHRILYDASHPEYKTVSKRNEMWIQVGRELNEDGMEIKKKWRNLRDSYAKYLKSISNDPNTKKNYKNWQWAKKMEVFRPYLMFGKRHTAQYESENSIKDDSENSTENYESEQDDGNDSTETKYIEAKLEISDEAEPFLATFLATTSSDPDPLETNTSTGKRKASGEIEKHSSEDTLGDYMNNKRHRTDLDGTDLIFLGYAKTIKTFSARRQSMVKLKIAQIIMEQELQHCDEEENSLSKRIHYNIDHLSNIFNYVLVPFGIFTVKRQNFKTKNSLFNTINSIILSCLLITSYINVYRTIHETYKTKKIINIIRFYRTLGSCLIIITMGYRKKYLEETTNNIKKVDKIIELLWKRPVYKKSIFFLILMILLTVTSCLICAITMETNVNAWVTFNRTFLLSYQFLISGIVMAILSALSFVILERIIWMEKLLKFIQNPQHLPNVQSSQEEVMCVLPEIYHHLYLSCISLNKFISVPVVILYSIDILIALLTLSCLFEQIGKPMEIVIFISCFWNLLITALPLMHIEKRLSQLLPILGECEECYTNLKMSNAKNTFLLQLKHETILFMVCGLYPVSIVTILEQLGFAISILIFLYQLEYD